MRSGKSGNSDEKGMRNREVGKRLKDGKVIKDSKMTSGNK